MGLLFGLCQDAADRALFRGSLLFEFLRQAAGQQFDGNMTTVRGLEMKYAATARDCGGVGLNGTVLSWQNANGVFEGTTLLDLHGGNSGWVRATPSAACARVGLAGRVRRFLASAAGGGALARGVLTGNREGRDACFCDR